MRSALDKKGFFVCHIVEAESAQKEALANYETYPR
jgi:hypothetical protein